MVTVRTWRWAARDLRRRWLSVSAIAVVIAIGTGVFAALGSTATWRRVSNDASFERLRVHDLELRVDGDTAVEAGRLIDLTGVLGDDVDGARETLRVRTQLELPTASGPVLVPGRLVSSEFSSSTDEIWTDAVDLVEVGKGAIPAEDDAGAVVLEEKFLDARGLEPPVQVNLAGGRTVTAVGSGVAPEDLIVSDERSLGFFAPGGFAVVYASRAVVEELSGFTSKVNGLVVDLVDGVDTGIAATRLADAARAAGVAVTVSTLDDLPSYRLLYDDIEGDQRVWRVLSALILGAAALAAFNLVGRVMDAQRREIGVQMALGVPPLRILRRPLIMAAQIALLGAVAGIGVGVLMARGMRALFLEVLPMPVWSTPFQTGMFARAAIIGFAVPFLASVLAARRVLRLHPVDAIHTVHRARPGSHPIRWAATRGRAITRLPIRNLLRAPRRGVLTALGVGASVASLVAILGLLDTFVATIERGEDELVSGGSDLLTIQFTGIRPVTDPTVTSLAGRPELVEVQTRLELPVILEPDGEEPIDLLVTTLDLDGPGWTPTIDDGLSTTLESGIVLATKALDDLGLRVGDEVVIEHPMMDDDGTFRSMRSSLTVVGTHRIPLRNIGFLDDRYHGLFGPVPLTNLLAARPAPGTTVAQAQALLFAQPGVASAQPITAFTEVFEDALDQFLGFLVLAAGAVLALSLLIAFNSTSISVDERSREHATMFAFGLPIRSVLIELAVEGALVGVVATLVGLALGTVLTHWMITDVVADTVPDLSFVFTIEPLTVILALAVGVLALSAAPLLVMRRLGRMEIPDALRVME